MLLQKTYDSFALAGADLKGEDREKYRTLSAELSALTTAFGQNVLRELNTYEIWLRAAHPPHDLAPSRRAISRRSSEMRRILSRLEYSPLVLREV